MVSLFLIYGQSFAAHITGSFHTGLQLALAAKTSALGWKASGFCPYLS